MYGEPGAVGNRTVIPVASVAFGFVVPAVVVLHDRDPSNVYRRVHISMKPGKDSLSRSMEHLLSVAHYSPSSPAHDGDLNVADHGSASLHRSSTLPPSTIAMMQPQQSRPTI